jgi:glutaredoxin
MEFLRKQGVPCQEVDVSQNRPAAEEIMRRTGQMGVPVITDAQEAIVGFDLPRLPILEEAACPVLRVRVTDRK